MIKFTPLDLDEMEPLRAGPRDLHGQFVPRDCPVVGCGGKLQYDGGGVWRCDGLVDPEHADKELIACEHAHFDDP